MILNQKINVGLVGNTGRMGAILSDLIANSPYYNLGQSFNWDQNVALSKVFEENDYIIDFSSANITKDLLSAAIDCPKPLIICTTGWSEKELQLPLEKLKPLIPIFIASNTSFGSHLQYYLSLQIAKILDINYDIDIIEKHHKHKIDIPSGTASTLIQGIKKVKKHEYHVEYEAMQLSSGPRPENIIGISASRSGNLPGEHAVIFTSDEEMISIKHIVFNRQLFAKGALKILDWMIKTKPKSGIYGMPDLFKEMFPEMNIF